MGLKKFGFQYLDMKIDMKCLISECATGKRKTAGGYIWSYNSVIEEKE